MTRILLFLLGSLTAYRQGQRTTTWPDPVAADPAAHCAADPAAHCAAPSAAVQGAGAHQADPGDAGPPHDPPGLMTPAPLTPGSTQTLPRALPPPGTVDLAGPTGPRRGTGPRRRRIPARLKWAAGLIVMGLIFRRAIAWLVLAALSAALHLVGLNVHLPAIRFGWPWQSISSGTTSNIDLGPWVLQKVEGISRPAFGQANFSFLFTHKVSKNIGIWPCWYQSTFYAVAHASATVDLNPGRAWWAAGTGHYRLSIGSRPQPGKPGRVSVAMTLPAPQVPQSAHDVTIDDIPSKPVDTQHSWTYPGLGCGVLLRPQFPESVLYAQAQQIAFSRSVRSPQVTVPLIRAAENAATQTIRDNFIQPTVNSFGYQLSSFTLSWAARP